MKYMHYTRWNAYLLSFLGVFLGALALFAAPSLFPALPTGVTEVMAPEVEEISGIATIPGGYAVVGDDEEDRALLTTSDATIAFPFPIADAESIDMVATIAGEQLWFVLSEDDRTVYVFNTKGVSYPSIVLPDAFTEDRGYGAEGLAVRRPGPGDRFEVAVLWQGGCLATKRKKGCIEHSMPKIIRYLWQPDREAEQVGGLVALNIPPMPDIYGKTTTGHYFSGKDLVWNGNGWLVLISSEYAGKREDEVQNKYTWLYQFDFAGQPQTTTLLHDNPSASVVKLEQCWGTYRDDKNWEALDWAEEKSALVTGYDVEEEPVPLSVVDFPLRCNSN